MSKGTITANLGAGQYVVQLRLDTSQIETQRTQLLTERNELNAALIPAAESEVTTAQAAYQAALSALSAAISTLSVPPTDAQRQNIQQLQRDATSARGSWAEAVLVRNTLVSRLVSIDRRLAYLTARTPSEDLRTVWCADYNTTLTGDIGLVEVNGRQEQVLIYPGGAAAADAAYTATRDGRMVPSVGQNPFGTYQDWALRAGWQKWLPTYRVGTLTSIDTGANTASVQLDVASSQDQALNITNPGYSLLTNVPIVYLTCNAAVFIVGDRVLVKFEGQRWTGAKVIGFESNPRACRFRIRIKDYDGATITPSTLLDLVGSTSDRKITIRVKRVSDGITFSRSIANGVLPGDVTFDGTHFEMPAVLPGVYWVTVRATHHVDTQYPARYLTADMENPADGVGPGTYDITLPRFCFFPQTDIPLPMLTAATSYERTTKVISSIPAYVVRFIFGGNELAACGLGPAIYHNLYDGATPVNVTLSSNHGPHTGVYAPLTCYDLVTDTVAAPSHSPTTGIEHKITAAWSPALNLSGALRVPRGVVEVGAYNSDTVQGFTFRDTAGF